MQFHSAVSHTVTQVPAAAGRNTATGFFGMLQGTHSTDRFCTVSNLFAAMLFLLARTPAAQALLRFAQSVAPRKLCLPMAARTVLLCTAVSVAQLCPHLLQASSGKARAMPFSGQMTSSIF